MAKETKTTSNALEDKKTAKKATKPKATAAKKTSVSKKAPAKKKTAAPKATVKKTAVKKTATKKTAPKAAKAKTPEPEKVTANTTDASAGANEQTTTHEASYQSRSDTTENTFPGLDKDRDWQSFALRVAYIITFGVLGWIAFGAAITMTIIQVVITILLGSPNETLQSWVSAIGKYLAEVFEYISWNTDEKPFPLGRPVPLDETSKS